MRRLPAWAGFAGFFLGFFALYAALRSPDLMAVDGAVRSCEVYHRPGFFFHGNNHLLYPVNVRAWDRLVGLAWGPCPGAWELARRAQLMNALAAAASVGILFQLVRGAGGSTGIASGVALAYGFSRALLLHATNAAEPPVGLLLSFLAVGVAALARGTGAWRGGLAALAGALLAAAVASYQSMALVGPAALILCAAPATAPAAGSPARRIHWIRALLFVAGGAAGLIVIFGWAYTQKGITGFGAQLRQLLTVDGAPQVYGGLSPSKVLSTPVGLVGNIFPAYPAGFPGVRRFWHEHGFGAWLMGLAALLAASSAVAATLGGLLWRSRGQLRAPLRVPLVVALVALAFTLVGPVYWNPGYDKMWLQPVAAGLALIGLGLAALPPSRPLRQLKAACAALVVVVVASNACWAVQQACTAPPYLQEARRIDAILRPDDSLVYGWDGVSMYYTSLYGCDRSAYCLPTAAHPRGAGVVDDLRAMIRETEARGGRVYFLGVLDLSEAAWQPFLGDRLGVPYHCLDEYRAHSRPVVTFPMGGWDITLRLYEPPPGE
jgi:hypothetical protein